MKSTFRSLVAAFVLAACGLAQAETIEFNSLNAKQGFPALFENRGQYTDKVAAVFTRPNNAVGDVPVMVIMHSSAGINTGGVGEWSNFFLRMGIATLVVDSFKYRNIQATTNDQSQMSWAATAADALLAMKEVAKLPGVDVNRIGVIGFSRGGVAAMNAGYVRVRNAVLGTDSTLKFALNVSFYGGCAMVGTPDPKQPELFILGDNDDALSIEGCAKFVEVVRSRGADIKSVIYPGATHGFDVERGTGKSFYLGQMQTWKKCGVAHIDIDNLTYVIAGNAVTPKDYGEFNGKCQNTGVTIRTDDAARAASQNEVSSFVRKNFAI